MLASDIKQGLNKSASLFTADNCMLSYESFTSSKMTLIAVLFLNGTQIPSDVNYNNPPAPYVINGVSDPTSQRCLVREAPFCLE
jgi:hypothetical protein